MNTNFCASVFDTDHLEHFWHTPHLHFDVLPLLMKELPYYLYAEVFVTHTIN